MLQSMLRSPSPGASSAHPYALYPYHQQRTATSWISLRIPQPSYDSRKQSEDAGGKQSEDAGGKQSEDAGGKQSEDADVAEAEAGRSDSSAAVWSGPCEAGYSDDACGIKESVALTPSTFLLCLYVYVRVCVCVHACVCGSGVVY
jgi:uncharacterized protein with LGFP repeats